MRVCLLWAALLCAVLFAPAYANEGLDALRSMSVEDRRAVLALLIDEEGDLECGEITRDFFAGRDADDNGYWDAACHSGQHYRIQIAPDLGGSTIILNCDLMRQIASASCFRWIEGAHP